MSDQITNQILMIRPVAFHMNEQTVVNNYYQKAGQQPDQTQIQKEARTQFDHFVEELKAKGVDVLVIEDSREPLKPDSIFPNNWISFHENGIVRLYPMFAPNRRLERRADILAYMKNEFNVSELVNYVHWEEKEMFLEGTGSMVLDRQNKIAYATISDRTMEEPLADFCVESGFDSVTFHAYQSVQGRRLPIYHTNVMMALGERFAVVCTDCIDNKSERELVENTLHQTGKEVISISERQVEQFAGNILQVVGREENRLIVMSSSAFSSLNASQIDQLSAHGEIVHSDIHTIEQMGGGSARCMMAEIFLKRNK